MPAVTAHHQFGLLIQQALCPEVQAFVQANQGYFALGFQGPDLLFYHKPLHKNPVSALGAALHQQPGYDFFKQALSQDLTPQQLAYVLGVCCHYGLDRSAHPYINQASHHHDTTHRKLESAFDCHIQSLYKLPAQRVNCLPAHLDPAPIAQVYGLPTAAVARALGSFQRVTRLLDWGYGLGLVERLGKGNNSFTALCLPRKPGYALQCLATMDCFTYALRSTPTLVEDVYFAAQMHLPCPRRCKENFEGCIPGENMIQ